MFKEARAPGILRFVLFYSPRAESKRFFPVRWVNAVLTNKTKVHWPGWADVLQNATAQVAQRHPGPRACKRRLSTTGNRQPGSCKRQRPRVHAMPAHFTLCRAACVSCSAAMFQRRLQRMLSRRRPGSRSQRRHALDSSAAAAAYASTRARRFQQEPPSSASKMGGHRFLSQLQHTLHDMTCVLLQ